MILPFGSHGTLIYLSKTIQIRHGMQNCVRSVDCILQSTLIFLFRKGADLKNGFDRLPIRYS